MKLLLFSLLFFLAVLLLYFNDLCKTLALTIYRFFFFRNDRSFYDCNYTLKYISIRTLNIYYS